MNKFLPVSESEIGDNKEYKVEHIQNITVYNMKANRYLLGLCYLVTWKGYLEKENT